MAELRINFKIFRFILYCYFAVAGQKSLLHLNHGHFEYFISSAQRILMQGVEPSLHDLEQEGRSSGLSSV